MKDDVNNIANAVAFYEQHKQAGDPWKKSAVAKRFNIAPRTFSNYVHEDPTKRIAIGARVGRQSIVSDEDKEFMVQLAVRADRANQGLTSKELAQNLMQLTETSRRPLTKEQSSGFVYKTLRKDERLKSNLIVAQKTTTESAPPNEA
jgi:hypothetical protein